MPAELTCVRCVEKPWGVSDLGRWGACHNGSSARAGRLIGELWFERPRAHDVPAALLLKVLLTSKALSVQVHPDDDYARSVGLRHGKTEAWYILSAEAGAQVAVGLTARLTKNELRSAIEDGTIAKLLAWRSVAAGDIVLVPAGTIHAIGAGLVLLEIQQNSDATYRILDPDHRRALHVEQAVAAARAEPAEFQVRAKRISGERSLLVSTEPFVFERIALPPNSAWCLRADVETWLFCQSGSAHAGEHTLVAGGCLFVEAAAIDVRVGADAMTCLVAYSGPHGPAPNLLNGREHMTATIPPRRPDNTGNELASPHRIEPAREHKDVDQ